MLIACDIDKSGVNYDIFFVTRPGCTSTSCPVYLNYSMVLNERSKIILKWCL